MVLKINCIHNNKNAWCNNKDIKRSFFGVGAIVCVEHNDEKCNLRQSKTRTVTHPSSISNHE